METTQETSESGIWKRNLEGWARALFEGIDDAVFVHDLDGRILDVNSAACRRLGYTREEFLNLNTRDIDDPDFADKFSDRLEKQMLEGHLRCEGRHRTKDGRSVLVDINTSLIEFRNKPCILAVMRDITRRKKIERHKAIQFSIAQKVMDAKSYDHLEPELLRTIAKGLHWDVAVLWTVDPRTEVLRYSSLWYRHDLPLRHYEDELSKTLLSKGSGLAGRTWELAEPIWVPDMLAEENYHDLGMFFQEAKLRQAFGFPIWSAGVVTGVIEAFCRRFHSPDEEVLNLAMTLGSQLGQVLERKRVEHALRESQAFYHSLVENLPQNIFRKDREGRVTFGNQRYCNLLKRPLKELIGKTDYDLFPREQAQKYRDDDARVLESGKPLELIEDHTLPDGRKIYVQVIKTPIHDSSGQIIGTQGLFWDVTEKVLAERILADSERRYRQLTEATQDGIIVAQSSGEITLFNPAAEKMFGYRAAEILGKPITILMPDEYVARHEEGMKRFVKTRKSRVIGKPIELKGLRKDGSIFPLELVLTALESEDDDNGKEFQFLGSIRDLTERNRMRSVVFQNEKLASIGLLSAGVAHEINNPLAYIGNNLAVLDRDLAGVMKILSMYENAHPHVERADPASAAAIRELIEDIDLPYIQQNLDRLIGRTREGVERVARIVNNLRGFARTTPSERQMTHLPDLIDSSLEMIRNRLRRLNIEVTTQYADKPSISCVSTQISQVLLNLFHNATQAIEAMKRSEGNWLKIAVKRNPGEMLIQVSDNGCGISPENISHIFDPFFTTKDVGEGTGLGLSISQTIIAAHGGHIEVFSKVNQGTTFDVLLPLDGE